MCRQGSENAKVSVLLTEQTTNCTFSFDASPTGWDLMGEVFHILTSQTARLGEKALKLV